MWSHINPSKTLFHLFVLMGLLGGLKSHINIKSNNFVVLKTASWCQPARAVQFSKEKDISIISQL